MGFKEIMKKGFDDDQKKLLYRYKASKIVFLLVCLLFFLSFFLAGAGFYRSFFIYTFSFLYILILFTLNIYIYMFFKKKFYGKIIGAKKFLLILFLIILTISLIFPVIFEGGIIGFYKAYLDPSNYDFSNFDLKETFSKTIEDVKNMLP